MKVTFNLTSDGCHFFASGLFFFDIDWMRFLHIDPLWTGWGIHMSSSEFDAQILYRAIWLYLDGAYFRTSVPAKVIEKTCFPTSAPLDEILNSKKIVESHIIDPEQNIEKYYIRLGNDFYPHMKLCVCKLPHNGSYICAVDTHDQHVLDILPRDSDQWQEFNLIHQKNMSLKKRIEKRWRREKVPTEQGYLEKEAPSNLPCKENFPLRYVLVVDDEEHIRMALKEILELFNCRAYVASNGKEGLEIARQHHADIAFGIFDIMMPGMTGLQMVDLLDEDGFLTFPFLYLSGMPREIAQKNGSINFLAKPFTKTILIDKIREMIDQLSII